MPTTTQHIPYDLVEKALALTGKRLEDVCDVTHYGGDYDGSDYDLSMEYFSYYLLSPEFIEKYFEYDKYNLMTNLKLTACNFGKAIYDYQSGDTEPLISLLEKIPGMKH